MQISADIFLTENLHASADYVQSHEVISSDVSKELRSLSDCCFKNDIYVATLDLQKNVYVTVTKYITDLTKQPKNKS